MKKIYAINGSPRQNGNTAQLLKNALAGAESAGAETELIQLGLLNFSGCRSCFACKRLKNPSPGCVIQDDLAPYLTRLADADGIIMGSPVYFGAETGLYRNFLERLFFPLLRYTDPRGNRQTITTLPVRLIIFEVKDILTGVQPVSRWRS